MSNQHALLYKVDIKLMEIYSGHHGKRVQTNLQQHIEKEKY
jgi:hypothetical protein